MLLHHIEDTLLAALPLPIMPRGIVPYERSSYFIGQQPYKHFKRAKQLLGVAGWCIGWSSLSRDFSGCVGDESCQAVWEGMCINYDVTVIYILCFDCKYMMSGCSFSNMCCFSCYFRWQRVEPDRVSRRLIDLQFTTILVFNWALACICSSIVNFSVWSLDTVV